MVGRGQRARFIEPPSRPKRDPSTQQSPAYYVVSEALTNAARHSGASVVVVDVASVDAGLRVEVTDDGCGGARPGGQWPAGTRRPARRTRRRAPHRQPLRRRRDADQSGAAMRVRSRMDGHTHLYSAPPRVCSQTQQFRTDIERVREQGFSVAQNERAVGLSSVAAPIACGDRGVVCALQVSGTIADLTPDRVEPLSVEVRRAAAAVSRRIA